MSHCRTCPICGSYLGLSAEANDDELPWVTVPDDYGTHQDLYKEEAMNIIKVKFLKAGEPSGRAYTYFSDQPVAVDDKVQINLQSVGIVTQIDVPEDEIADYKDKVKFITGRYHEPAKCCNYCANCTPIGEGDHICTEFTPPVMVISEYEPTDEFNKCNGTMWEEM